MVFQYGNVDGQDVARVHAGLRGLHGDEGFQKHACAGEEHEGSRNLDHGEGPKTAIGAPGDADAAAGEAGGLGNVGAREARNKGEKNRGDNGKNRAHP